MSEVFCILRVMEGVIVGGVVRDADWQTYFKLLAA